VLRIREEEEVTCYRHVSNM